MDQKCSNLEERQHQSTKWNQRICNLHPGSSYQDFEHLAKHDEGVGCRVFAVGVGCNHPWSVEDHAQELGWHTDVAGIEVPLVGENNKLVDNQLQKPR